MIDPSLTDPRADLMPQSQQQQNPLIMDDGADKPRRSRSNTTTSSKEKLRPKSRGSTASLQSVGVGTAFQPPPPAMSVEHNTVYHVQPPPSAHMMYAHNPDDAFAHYQHTMAAQMHPHPIQPAMGQQDMRPMSRQSFQDIQAYPTQYPGQMAQYPRQHQNIHHVRYASEQYEGSPAPEDSGTENAARRRKGNATTVANDQELRRLLVQYKGKSLPEVAHEVQRNEGSGGKSEKAKQVFAMLW
jgi:regulatory factor X